MIEREARRYVAIEVPEMRFVAEGLPIQTDRMFTPGAQIAPKLEKDVMYHSNPP